MKTKNYKLHILYTKGFADNPSEYVFADWDRFFKNKRILTGIINATEAQIKAWAKEWVIDINKRTHNIRNYWKDRVDGR